MTWRRLHATADLDAIFALFQRATDYFFLQDGERPTIADAYDFFTEVPPGHDAAELHPFGQDGANGLDRAAILLPDYPERGIWYLAFTIAAPEARGKGDGRRFHDALLALAEAQGATHFRLAVLEANIDAVRIWQALGYFEIRRTGPDRFKSRTHRRIEMERVLRPDAGRVRRYPAAIAAPAPASPTAHDAAA